MEVELLGRNKYFVTYVDDVSRRVWVFLLKSKDQVFQTFQEFHAMVERETEKPFKCLRSDNGDEYTSHKFSEYCVKHGIRHEKIPPHLAFASPRAKQKQTRTKPKPSNVHLRDFQ